MGLLFSCGFMWIKRYFFQVSCRGPVNFSSMVPLWIIFSILGALQTVCGGASFQNHAGLYLEKSRKNKQSETAAEGERILSFISSFPCSFWEKKIFSLKKSAIVTCIKRKKEKN